MKALPGGHPFEQCLVVSVHGGPGGEVFVGAVLEDKNGLRWIEATGKEQRWFLRAPVGAPFVVALVKAHEPAGLPAGYLELDLVTRALGRDPQVFWAKAATAPGVSVVEAYPRAICLARWGHRGARAVQRL